LQGGNWGLQADEAGPPIYKQLTTCAEAAGMMSGNAFTPMSRSTLLILRILAIGGALTVLACHVVRRQQEATAGVSGDRGAAGANAVPPTPAVTYISGTKSLQALPLKPPAGQSSGDLATSQPPQRDWIILGTKSAPVLSPADLQPTAPSPAPTAAAAPQPPARPAFPSTKSARMITPAEVQRFQQQQAPAAQQSTTPQR
jgi:hypothetical protein